MYTNLLFTNTKAIKAIYLFIIRQDVFWQGGQTRILHLSVNKQLNMISQHTQECVCHLCGNVFASEIEKVYHMGTCDKADGLNFLHRSREDPVRALYR